MKKIILSNDLVTQGQNSQEQQIQSRILIKNTDNDIYQLRKSNIVEYKAFFQALFQIPDETIHSRVLDAINGRELCVNCKEGKLYKDNSTQTDNRYEANNIFNTSKENINNEEIKTKKRRRKSRVPQVRKDSQALHAQEIYETAVKKMKTLKDIVDIKDTVTMANFDIDNHTTKNNSKKISFDDSFIFLEENGWDALVKMTESNIKDSQKKLHKDIDPKIELAEYKLLGFLPIHCAVVMNNMEQLQEQLYIQKISLNNVVTPSNLNCLQLAVINNCQASTMHTLLQTELNLSCIDSEWNNIIHLALINEINYETFVLLLWKIDLPLLLETNDNGFTPLHIAVRQNLPLHAELMINIMEDRLLDKITYERTSMMNYEKSQKKELEYFKAYYSAACNNLKASFKDKAQLNIKKRFLEFPEKRSGSTALLYALENGLEHFVLFLLAHLTDPRIENLSGQKPISYFIENCKTARNSSQVGTFMDNVIALIDKQ